MIVFSYFQYIKYAYIREEEVQKAPNCAYVIYEWYLVKFFLPTGIKIAMANRYQVSSQAGH